MTKRKKPEKALSKYDKLISRLDKIKNRGVKLGIPEDYIDNLIYAYNMDSIEFFDNLGDENLNEEQMNFIHAYFNW